MIGPRVSDVNQENLCVRNFKINNFLGHSMNCDSADYMLNASNPKRLLEEDSVRQARPGLIVNAFIFSFFIDNFISLFGYQNDYPKITIIENSDKKYSVFENFNPKIVYISYFLINLKFLLLSIFFYFKLFRKSIFNPLHYKDWIIWLSLLLVINNVVNQFMWSPSTKLLNIFCSLYTIYFSREIILKELSSKQILLLNLVSGILILYYAVFFISFVVINLFYVFSYRKHLLLIIASSICFLTPYMLWYGYVVSLNGKFYFSNISDYNFVIWIIDSFNNFGFFKTAILILEGYYFFFSSFLSQYFIFIALIFFILIFSIKKKIFYFNSPVILSSTIFIFFFSSFFVILGHKPMNITACLIAPIIILFSEILLTNRINMINENFLKKLFL